jgi:putative transposase
VVAPARWREIVAWSRVAYRLSQRPACGALEVARSSVRYIGRRPPQTALRRRLREIAEVRLHYGYRRMHVLLRREGWMVTSRALDHWAWAQQVRLDFSRPGKPTDNRDDRSLQRQRAA